MKMANLCAVALSLALCAAIAAAQQPQPQQRRVQRPRVQRPRVVRQGQPRKVQPRKPVQPVRPQRPVIAPNSQQRAYVMQAARGHGDAQNSLARRYENGEHGVRRDLIQALKWYLRSAALGNAYARERVHALQAVMTRQQIAQARLLAASGGAPVEQTNSAVIVEITPESQQPPAQASGDQTIIINGDDAQQSAPQQTQYVQASDGAGDEEYHPQKSSSYIFVGTMTDNEALDSTPTVMAAAAPEWEYQIPQGVPNNDAIGVIIAPSVYSNKDIPAVKYALNDARLMKEYFTKVFGIQEGNIIYAENPTLAQFNRIFGTADNAKGELANYIKPGKSDVYIYYVGHGAPDMDSHKAYFVPVDGSPDYVRTDGYALDTFYANLAKLPAKSVNVFLDACFSGGSPAGSLVKSASPLALQVKEGELPHNINVLASSSENQISSWYDAKGHSLFTYYLLGMISTKASGGGKLSAGDLYQLVNEDVTYSARKMFGRDQVPQFHGDPKAVLLQYK
jgi:hypothetical protein